MAATRMALVLQPSMAVTLQQLKAAAPEQESGEAGVVGTLRVGHGSVEACRAVSVVRAGGALVGACVLQATWAPSARNFGAPVKIHTDFSSWNIRHYPPVERTAMAWVLPCRLNAAAIYDEQSVSASCVPRLIHGTLVHSACRTDTKSRQPPSALLPYYLSVH